MGRLWMITVFAWLCAACAEDTREFAATSSTNSQPLMNEWEMGQRLQDDYNEDHEDVVEAASSILRAVVSSQAFAQCVESRAVEQPYVPCNERSNHPDPHRDPWRNSTQERQIHALLDVSRTVGPSTQTSVRTLDGDAHGLTRHKWMLSTTSGDTERFALDRSWLSTQYARMTAVESHGVSTPFAQRRERVASLSDVAGIMLHELTHVRGYFHENFDDRADSGAGGCGNEADYYQSAPEILQYCAMHTIEASRQHCEDVCPYSMDSSSDTWPSLDFLPCTERGSWLLIDGYFPTHSDSIQRGFSRAQDIPTTYPPEATCSLHGSAGFDGLRVLSPRISDSRLQNPDTLVEGNSNLFPEVFTPSSGPNFIGQDTNVVAASIAGTVGAPPSFTFDPATTHVPSDMADVTLHLHPSFFEGSSGSAGDFFSVESSDGLQLYRLGQWNSGEANENSLSFLPMAELPHGAQIAGYADGQSVWQYTANHFLSQSYRDATSGLDPGTTLLFRDANGVYGVRFFFAPPIAAPMFVLKMDTNSTTTPVYPSPHAGLLALSSHLPVADIGSGTGSFLAALDMDDNGREEILQQVGPYLRLLYPDDGGAHTAHRVLRVVDSIHPDDTLSSARQIFPAGASVSNVQYEVLATGSFDKNGLNEERHEDEAVIIVRNLDTDAARLSFLRWGETSILSEAEIGDPYPAGSEPRLGRVGLSYTQLGPSNIPVGDYQAILIHELVDRGVESHTHLLTAQRSPADGSKIDIFTVETGLVPVLVYQHTIDPSQDSDFLNIETTDLTHASTTTLTSEQGWATDLTLRAIINIEFDFFWSRITAPFMVLRDDFAEFALVSAYSPDWSGPTFLTYSRRTENGTNCANNGCHAENLGGLTLSRHDDTFPTFTIEAAGQEHLLMFDF